MTNKRTLMIGLFLVMTFSIISCASAQTLPYYYGGTANFSESCTTGQDFVLQVPPGACQPTVVRSDLLAEQDVPVYCNIIGIKINPLIDVPYIRSITPLGFTATKDVSGIHFYPAKASVATTPGMAPVGTPSSINNLGWLVVQLKQKPVEKDIPDKIELNLTAKIKYELQNSFGIAESEMTLTEMTEDSWKNVAERYSFWRGKGYVRAMKVDENSASFAVYDSSQRSYQTVTVKKGETSLPVYLPGFYCSAGVKIDLKDINFPSTKAIIVVNGIERVVSEKMPIYEGSKCIVSKITSGISPYIEISCPDGKYSLSSVPRDASLIVDGNKTNVKQGGIIKNNVYLIYAGNEDSQNYIVVLQTDKPSEINDKVLEVRTKITNLHAEGKKVLGNSNDFNDYTVISQQATVNKISISIASDFIALGTTIHADNVEDNFKKAVAAAEDTESKYTYVKNDAGDSYGLVALKKAADLAGELKKTDEQVRLLTKIVDIYKDENISEERNKLDLLVSSESSSVSFLDKSTGQSFFVVLRSIDLPDKNDNFATVNIDGGQRDIGVGESISEAWYVGKITDSCINVISVVGGESKTVSICKDETQALPVGNKTTSVKVLGTKVNKEAYARLIPFSKEGETVANFTVQIGVEKRAIQLTPDQMNEHIKKVSELSAKIEDWNSKLRPLIQNWKLACFATQATLAVKNLIFTPQGEARKAAMHGMTINGKQNGGWTEFCSGKIGGGTTEKPFKTLDACYKHYANNINKDVSSMKKAMEDTNSDVQRIKQAHTDANGKLDENAYITDALTNSGNTQLAAIAKDDNFATLRANGDITKEDVKDLIFLQKMKANCAGSTSPMCSSAGGTAVKNFTAILTDIIESDTGKLKIIADGEKSIKNAAGSSSFWAAAADLPSEGAITTKGGIYSKGEFDKAFSSSKGFDVKAIDEELTSDSSYRVSGIKGTTAVIAVVQKTPAGTYRPISAYNKQTGVKLDAAQLEDLGIDLNSIRINGIDVSSTVYPFSETSPQVRFWEDGKYKGFAAIVPFEYKGGGYYVKMNKADYEQNGQPLALNIYNVGSDGKIEDGGNDISIQSLNVAQLTADNELANTALKAVRAANTQYGNKAISILEKSYAVGKAAVDIPGYQCQDFMSPSDCSVLFNVCDPVLCPPSRCNLGGTYNTANVVQSGIIGSMVLCSKNSVVFGGDVVVPICLTGLNAGLENLNSVLKSYRDCMNESLTTGKTVGICDEIYSIYICELVWREALPFVTQGIPSIVTAMLHQGGGEYTSFQSNWNNFVGTVGYFTSQYAETAFEAFKIRSTVQVGTEACKLFFSLRYPDLIDLVDKLTKAESPPQFFAYFDEISFTTVTYPSTSQYKVYYHIYAGEDKGINYNIYLSSPAYASGTFVSPVQLIDTGFLAQGQYKDATKDLLAPAGYKELCIEIDGQRNCGFGKVGTEFTINYLSDKYVQSQLTQEINSKDECISGTPSLLALVPGVSANIEEGVVQATNPSLQKTGVTRICSADNPGKGTSESRWNFVGWCDKDAKLACWVDRTTVEGAIKDLGILNQTLNYSASVVASYLDAKGYLTQQESSTKLTDAKNALAAIDTQKALTTEDKVAKLLESVKNYGDIEDNSFFLDEKAQASLGIAESYIKKVEIEAKTEPTITPAGGGAGGGAVIKPLAVTKYPDAPFSVLFEPGYFDVARGNLKDLLAPVIDNTNDGETLIIDGYMTSEEKKTNSNIALNRIKYVRSVLPSFTIKNINTEEGKAYTGTEGKVEIRKKCIVQSLKWGAVGTTFSEGTVSEGDVISLVADIEGCSNVNITFNIYRYTNLLTKDVLVSTLTAKCALQSGTKCQAIAKWTTVWKEYSSTQNPNILGGPDNQDYFTVKIYGEESKRSSYLTNLYVTPKVTNYNYTEQSAFLSLSSLADKFGLSQTALRTYTYKQYDNSKVLSKNSITKGQSIVVPLTTAQFSKLSLSVQNEIKGKEI